MKEVGYIAEYLRQGIWLGNKHDLKDDKGA